MSEEDWGTAGWQDAHFPADQLDAEGDSWGIRWRGMEKLRHRSYIKLVTDQLCGADSQNILDIGCALCDFTEKAWKVNTRNHLFGMDISPTAIQWCQQKFPQFALKAGALPELPFEEKFDGVFCLEVLCYLSPEERKQTIHNIYNVLDNGGWMMFSGVLDGGERYHTEGEVNEMLHEYFDVVAKTYNYWWLYRQFFETPLDRLRAKLEHVRATTGLSDEDIRCLANGHPRSKAVAINRWPRVAVSLVRAFLRFGIYTIRSLLGSHTVAMVLKRVAMVFGGKRRADEIVVLARRLDHAPDG